MQIKALAALALAGSALTIGGAAPVQSGARYAALVEDHSSGYRSAASSNQATEEDARREAIAKCGNKASCEVVLTFSGRGCGAFSSASATGAYNWSVGPALEATQDEARRRCTARARPNEVCGNQVSVCNTEGPGTASEIFVLRPKFVVQPEAPPLPK